MKFEELLTTGDIAKGEGVSRELVNFWQRSGKLRVAARSRGGIRLFDRAEVERFLAERASRKAMVRRRGR